MDTATAPINLRFEDIEPGTRFESAAHTVTPADIAAFADITRDPGGREVAFRMTDGAQTYNVVYRGITPDTFTDGVDVVVEGRLGRDNTFRATTLLAKCASRYENAPDKYRDTPGYKQGQKTVTT